MCSCRYHMLGMFLLIQLSIVGGDWLRRCALPALATSMRSHAVDPLLTARGNFIHFGHLKISSASFTHEVWFCPMFIVH
jgi:hypothetical protein